MYVGKFWCAKERMGKNRIKSFPFENEAIKNSIKQHRHIYGKNFEKPIKEIQKTIRSYEKLIIEHKDKIANPSKYYSYWNELNTKRRDDLINKK